MQIACVQPGATLALPVGQDDATPVRVFGTSATIAHSTDHAERDRRCRAGLGHLDSLELLDALMELPTHTPLPWSSLSSSTAGILRRAPSGAVRSTRSSVTRLAVPVVTPALAVVYAAEWRQGLARASQFAAYCPRMFVVPGLPATAVEVLSEASWYGVGVAVGNRLTPTVVLEPEPVTAWQPTVAWWRFCERVYRHCGDRV